VGVQHNHAEVRASRQSSSIDKNVGIVTRNETAFARARTVDPLIKSQQADLHNTFPANTCDNPTQALAPTLVPAVPSGSLIDPDLIHLIRAWDRIPENMRAVIKSMAALALPVEAVKPANSVDDRLPWEAKE
jgi:hypothetical protein